MIRPQVLLMLLLAGLLTVSLTSCTPPNHILLVQQAFPECEVRNSPYDSTTYLIKTPDHQILTVSLKEYSYNTDYLQEIRNSAISIFPAQRTQLLPLKDLQEEQSSLKLE